MKYGGAGVQGRSASRHPIRASEPDIVFGAHRLPASVLPPRHRGTAVGMLSSPEVRSHLRPALGHDAVGRVPDRRTPAAARHGLPPGRRDDRAHFRSEAVVGRVHGQPFVRRCGRTKCRRSAKRIGASHHGTLGAGRVFEGDARLRRVGVGHRASCRRNGGGLQQEKEGRTQPLPPLSHRRPDRPGPRCPSSSRKRPRFRRGRNLQPPYGPRTPVPSPRAQAQIGARCAGRRLLPAFPARAGTKVGTRIEGALPPSRVRSKAGNDGAVWGGPDCFGTRWKPKSWNAATASSPSEGRSDTNTNTGCRSDPLNTGTNSRSSSPASERTRAMSLAFHEGRGRRRISSPNPKRIAEWITSRSATNRIFAGILARNPTCELRFRSVPAAQPQSVLCRGASGRWESFAAPSSGASDALSDRPANRSSP